MLGSLGRWTARHPWIVLAAWVLLLVLAAVSSNTFTSRLSTQTNTVNGSDSSAATSLVEQEFPDAPDETDFAVVHSDVLTTADQRFRTQVGKVVEGYRARPEVADVIDPLTPGSALVSADQRTVLVPVTFEAAHTALDRAEPLQDVAKQLAAPNLDVWFTGYSPVSAATIDRAGEDLSRAEGVGFPAAAVVLLIAFGSVVAAGLPLALGGIAVVASFGLLGVLAHVLTFNPLTQSAVTMLAIALGIDYSLFIVTRFREELAAARETGGDAATREGRADAVGRTLATAGHAVLFSGTTVMVSLGGLLLVRSPGLRAMAVGMMVGVLAMLGLAMTLLPAILGLLGHRINALALPWARRSLAHPDPERSAWARIVGAVLRRPLPVALVVTAGLGLVAAPAFSLRYGLDIGAGAVRETPAGQGLTVMSGAFAPGLISPVNVVTRNPAGPLTAAQLDAVSAYTTRAGAGAAAVTSVTSVLDRRAGAHGTAILDAAAASDAAAVGSLVSSDRDTTLLTVYPRAAADADSTQDLVRQLRADAASVLGAAGLETHVGGTPALIRDVTAENSRATPLVIAVVLAASWVLLLFVFRSVVLAFEAICLNALSVGAAFGAVVWVFQEGHGANLLDVDRTGFIQIMLPLLTFAVAFGLSMDYEVFLVSRMREEWLRTGDNTRAVRTGILHTARVITSAALIMVVVFASFMLATLVDTKQLGFMLTVAVLVDATVVRMFLVPAVMHLLGRWNWWAPRIRPSRSARNRARLRSDSQ